MGNETPQESGDESAKKQILVFFQIVENILFGVGDGKIHGKLPVS